MSSPHWAQQQERGSRLFLWLTTQLVRYLPATLMKPITAVVVAYYYATSPKARRNIVRYQARLQQTYPYITLPQAAVFQQFLAFGEAIADRFAVWQHKIRYEDLRLSDPDHVYGEIGKHREQRGQIFVCSHVGNVEVCRALVGHHEGFKLNVLVHSKHAQAFNEALEKAGADRIQLIQVSDLNAAVMLDLHARIDRGEWIAIAADRVPVHGEKTVSVQFLGQSAQMPQGAWLLAALLKTKLHTLFCIKENGRYTLKLRHFSDGIATTRGKREQEVAAAAQQFADILAAECANAPLQWFNFYDFWEDGQ